MRYESTQQALTAMARLQQSLSAYRHAEGVLYLDATTAAPSDTWEGRGKTMEVLSQAIYDLTTAESNGPLFACLKDHLDELTPQQQRELEVLSRDYDRFRRIPAEEYVAYSVLLNDADAVWH